MQLDPCVPFVPFLHASWIYLRRFMSQLLSSQASNILIYYNVIFLGLDIV